MTLPPTLLRPLKKRHCLSTLLYSLTVPTEPKAYPGEQITSLAQCGLVTASFRLFDGTLGAVFRQLLISQVAVSVAKPEIVRAGQNRLPKLLQTLLVLQQKL